MSESCRLHKSLWTRSTVYATRLWTGNSQIAVEMSPVMCWVSQPTNKLWAGSNTFIFTANIGLCSWICCNCDCVGHFVETVHDAVKLSAHQQSLTAGVIQSYSLACLSIISLVTTYPNIITKCSCWPKRLLLSHPVCDCVDFVCESGQFLDISSDQQCHDCPAGTFSLGGAVLFKDWTHLPAGFSTSLYSYTDSDTGRRPGYKCSG